MQRYVAQAVVLALCACGENGQFVGDDLGDDYATPAGAEATFAMPSRRRFPLHKSEVALHNARPSSPDSVIAGGGEGKNLFTRC